MKQKNKQPTLKLYVKPGESFKLCEFVWLTASEIPEYIKDGYIRAKKFKEGTHDKVYKLAEK